MNGSEEGQNTSRGLPRRLEVILQKIILAVKLFARNELPNQAGASTYFFLLSAAPVLLMLVYGVDQYLDQVPGLSDRLLAFLSRMNPNLREDLLRRLGSLEVSSSALGIVGVLSLLAASRLIFTSIQRSFTWIFAAESPRPPLIMNLLSILLVPVLFVAILLAILVSVALSVVNSLSIPGLVSDVVKTLLSVLNTLWPVAFSFLLVFSLFRYLPSSRPRTRSALEGALVHTLLSLAFRPLFSLVFRAARYNLVYGVFGSLIVLLVWTYFAFLIFYIAAEYTYVTENLDVLLMESMYGLALQESGRVENLLFREPKTVVRKYASLYEQGERIIEQGDTGQEIYYVHRGEVEITLRTSEGERIVRTIGQGEFFGEMSYLLAEPRTAGAKARTRATVFSLDPDTFEGLLRNNHLLSRNVIRMLCDRLKATTGRGEPNANV